jgi:tetratricopeptide (TPR) repeat protein
MKKSIVLFLLSIGLTNAQIVAPQPSPLAKIEQTVGLTQVSIEYSRPSMRGRTVMGDLVPYGEIWRTGANRNTTFSFSDAITIGKQEIAAGTYALYSRPGISMWEVFFYNRTDNPGLPEKWDPKAIAATIEVPIRELDTPVETFSIALETLHNEGATLQLKWETTQIDIPFKVPTDAKTMASIEKTISGSPKPGDYYAAAVYYRETNRDLNTAKQWIAKAVEQDPGKYWMYRQQALILAGLNELDAAVEAAKTSLELAEKAGNKDYVRLNTKSIEEWSN